MREGQLTMILYGANEALLWARRVAAFQHYMRWVGGVGVEGKGKP